MSFPNWDYETCFWKKGFTYIGGCDEVGRGCFAGPVVAGVVIFKKKSDKLQIPPGIRIDDSKKLTPRQRQKADVWIRENALSFGIGICDVPYINKYGIVKATQKAIRRAIINCGVRIEYLLSDAFYIPYLRNLGKKKQTPIVKGDQKSFSIASASIIAKVFRDNLMSDLSLKYKYYCWNLNKGYGTKKHILAIKQYGITPIHRIKFVETTLCKSRIFR